MTKHAAGKTLCFDLFETLISLRRDFPPEREILGLDWETWNACIQTKEQYFRRGSGLVREPIEIIREMVAACGRTATPAQEEEMLRRRAARFGDAVTRPEPEILETLRILKAAGHRLCLISNADAIDTMHWTDSPLAPLLDIAIFSWQVGIVKPEAAIYLLAAERLGVPPAKCVFIGDGGQDELAGAKRVGMRTVQTRQYLNREITCADAVVDHLRELINVIPTLPTGPQTLF